jgi:hypothetical protein
MRTVAKKQKTETLPEVRQEAPPPAVRDPRRFRRFGNIGVTDMEIPALWILHALSKVVKANRDLEPGNFFHSILEQDLGDELEVVVLLVHHHVRLETPKDPRGGLPVTLAKAMDGKHWDKPNQRFEVQFPSGKKGEYFTGKDVESSGLLEWGTSDPGNPNSVPAARHVYTVVLRILKPRIEGPILYSGSVSTNKKIMQLNSKIDLRMAAGVEPVRQIYRLTTEERQGPQGGNWFVPNFTAAGELPEDDPRVEEFFLQAERLNELYPSIKVVGVQELDDEIPTAGATNAAF